MARYVFECTIKEHSRTSSNDEFVVVPTACYVTKRIGEKDKVKTFAVLQPCEDADTGLAFKYDSNMKVVVKSYMLSIGTTVCLELDNQPDDDNVKKIALGNVDFEDLKSYKFALIKVTSK